MTAVLSVLMIALGGALGALIRWGLALAGRLARSDDDAVHVPWTTFVANMLACLLLGMVAVTYSGAPGDGRQLAFLLLGTGVAGTASTMSAFALESLELVRRGAPVIALGYSLLSIGGGMIALWIGLVIGS